MHLTIAEKLRSRHQEPFASVREMGVAEGMRVADLGSGLGYFTVPAAVTVGEKGLVYSVEPDPARSAKVEARVRREGLGNVRVVTAKAEQLGAIPTGGVDLAFSAFTMHHFEDRSAALAEVRRILRDGGTFYLWDRVPGRIMKWGTRPEELSSISAPFRGFEPLSTRKILRARFTR